MGVYVNSWYDIRYLTCKCGGTQDIKDWRLLSTSHHQERLYEYLCRECYSIITKRYQVRYGFVHRSGKYEGYDFIELEHFDGPFAMYYDKRQYLYNIKLLQYQWNTHIIGIYKKERLAW